MPPYHVHFRVELQTAIEYLFKAYEMQQRSLKEEDNLSSSEQHQQQIQMMIQRSNNIFRSSMQGLHGHVSIEEYACFPLYQQTYPHVTVSFLTNDHKELHKQEETTQKSLSELSLQSSPSKQAIQETLGVVLDFDQHLLAHLGEEEEIVVPMLLTEKTIHF